MKALDMTFLMTFLTSCFCFAALPAIAEEPRTASSVRIKLNAGLEAELVSVGRQKGGYYITVAMRLSNGGPAPVQIALVGPTPMGTDDAGTSYTMPIGRFSGAAMCRELGVSYVAACLTGEQIGGHSFAIPMQAFTQLDPGTTATLSFELNGREGTGRQFSFSSVFAYRVVPDALADETTQEAVRRKQFKTMSISFPPYPITDQK